MFSFHLKVTYNTKNVLAFSLFSSFRFQFCKCVLQNTQLIEAFCTWWLVRTSCIFCFKAWWVTLSLECFQLVFLSFDLSSDLLILAFTEAQVCWRKLQPQISMQLKFYFNNKLFRNIYIYINIHTMLKTFIHISQLTLTYTSYNRSLLEKFDLYRKYVFRLFG